MTSLLAGAGPDDGSGCGPPTLRPPPEKASEIVSAVLSAMFVNVAMPLVKVTFVAP